MIFRVILVKAANGGPKRRVPVHQKRPRAAAAVRGMMRKGLHPCLIRARLGLSQRRFRAIRLEIASSPFKP